MTPNLPTAAYDNKIYSKFSKKTIEKKSLNKEEFQKEFSLIPEKKTLLLGITTELTDNNGFELLEDLLAGIENLDIQLAIKGVGTAKFQQLIVDFADKHQGKVTVLEDNEDNLRKLYAAADAVVFFTLNKETEQEIANALSYGVVPIAPALKGVLDDYNPNQESGNAFIFKEGSIWSAYEALVRANENYRFPYDWKTICKNAIS